MQFTTAFIAAASALAASTNAAAIQRDGARLAQFRVFSAPGCYDLNQGFFTVDQSDVGGCHSLSDFIPAPGVLSLNLESLQTAADGCALYTYTDTECEVAQSEAQLNVCQEAPSEAGWGSWEIACPANSA